MKLFDPCVKLLDATSRIWPQACLRLFTMLVSAGWTFTRSGDGMSAFALGNVFTNAGNTGTPLSIGNNGAWAVLRAPGTNGRQLLFYTAANGTLTLRYSIAAGFTGGDATTPATATDAVNVFGTVSFFGGLSMYQGGGGNYRCSIMVDNEAPYGWWLWMNKTADTTVCHTLLMFDPLAPGTSVNGDLDPYVFVGAFDSTHGPFYNGAAGAIVNMSNETVPYTSGGGGGAPYGYGCKGYLYKGTGDQEFRGLAINYPGNGGFTQIMNSLGPNLYNGKDWLVNAPYAAASTVYGVKKGWKGMSSLMRFCGSSRSLGDTFNVSAPRQYVYVRGMVLDWDGSVPVLGN